MSFNPLVTDGSAEKIDHHKKDKKKLPWDKIFSANCILIEYMELYDN